jgi:hypothetical protein
MTSKAVCWLSDTAADDVKQTKTSAKQPGESLSAVDFV